MKFAVVKTGGKQYLVHENDEIYVDRLIGNPDDKISLETLATGDESTIEMGAPVLKTSIQAQIIENVKGDKVEVYRFKAKTRYRKHHGFRAFLTKLKILSI